MAVRVRPPSRAPSVESGSNKLLLGPFFMGRESSLEASVWEKLDAGNNHWTPSLLNSCSDKQCWIGLLNDGGDKLRYAGLLNAWNFHSVPFSKVAICETCPETAEKTQGWVKCWGIGRHHTPVSWNNLRQLIFAARSESSRDCVCVSSISFVNPSNFNNIEKK